MLHVVYSDASDTDFGGYTVTAIRFVLEFLMNKLHNCTVKCLLIISLYHTDG